MNMKKFFLLFALMFAIGFSAISGEASMTGDKPVKGEEPLLITNAGQGPGGKMGRLLVSRSKVVQDMTYNAEPTAEDLVSGGYKMVLVVIGSSAKGLGASGITIDDEIARLEVLMETCKEKGIPVIAAHIEGQARRGKPGSADERAIEAIAPYAQGFIVKSDSNADGLFSRWSEKNGAPLTVIDETMGLVQVIKEMYAQ